MKNNLHKVIIYKKAASTPLKSFLAKHYYLQEIISKFNSKNVFNANETEFFYCIIFNHTLAIKLTLGKKIDKAKLTVLLVANSTRTKKIQSISY